MIIDLTDKCGICGKEVKVTMTEKQYEDWQNGELIQNVCPELTTKQREFLISRICSTCFDKIFYTE